MTLRPRGLGGSASIAVISCTFATPWLIRSGHMVIAFLFNRIDSRMYVLVNTSKLLSGMRTHKW